LPDLAVRHVDWKTAGVLAAVIKGVDARGEGSTRELRPPELDLFR
jgi:hypothetical protein